MQSEQIAKLLIQLSVFGIVVALWMAGVVVWMLRRSQRRLKLERRLQFAQQGGSGRVDDERVIRLWHDGNAIDTFVPETESMNIGERLERMRQDAGWTTPMPRILAMLAVFVLFAGLLTWIVSGRLLPVLGVACVVVMVFRAYLLSRIGKRTALFEKQLVEALDLGGRSLRAGHPLNGAFKLIASEVAPP